MVGRRVTWVGCAGQMVWAVLSGGSQVAWVCWQVGDVRVKWVVVGGEVAWFGQLMSQAVVMLASRGGGRKKGS